MICFSDWLPDPEDQLIVGRSMITISISNTALNFSLVLCIGLWGVLLSFKKYWRRLRRFFNPNYMRPFVPIN